MAQTDTAQTATKSTERSRREANVTATPPTPPASKRDRLRMRLEQADGASLQQLQGEFGWQAHTVRAAISGLRKAGCDVRRGTGAQSSVYRIVTPVTA